jgi:hypothetical protein
MRKVQDFFRLVDASTSDVYQFPINPTDIYFGQADYTTIEVLDGPPVRTITAKDYVDGTIYFFAVPEKYSGIITLFEDIINKDMYMDLEEFSYISHILDTTDSIEINIYSIDVNFNYRGHTKFNLVANFKRKVFDYEI